MHKSKQAARLRKQQRQCAGVVKLLSRSSKHNELASEITSLKARKRRLSKRLAKLHTEDEI